ncbi:protein-glutamate O-methyltransferase CheR [Halodesulfovibrio sp.]|jgi:chemotaxis protein methyltransferase CheR|uniref:CheR family methyltransferase n=1 Tax=Halodesulfovibrio sp. TaxID=1912772 RepID=UPI0025FC1BFA|nr:protein-glutamate O-methyltransferase CheR [Halodesulfovibrio sp.]MCT4626466.1 protein-glutamate O-methyltransferase CheR [Halodesulfovibrio sp.]
MGDIEQVENERLEVELLLEAIYRRYGYDFRKYASAHTKRRLEHRRQAEGLPNLSAVQHHLIHDEAFFNRLLLDLSINVTEMFRDPWFYKAVRELVVPYLQTYPFVKVWHAGCSAGQEVYSMGIVMHEEGMMDRVQTYATDFNELILAKAKDGIYPVNLVREYTANYQQAGGTCSFSDYYTADYESVVMKRFLKEPVLFSSHNLVTDGVFGEMNAIFCRNVLIYFNRELQNRVLNLFYESLCPGGFLCLGSKENIKFSDVAHKFEVVAEREKIYRKKRM